MVLVWICIDLATGLFCLYLESFSPPEDGLGAAEVDVGRVQSADAFVVVVGVVPTAR